MKKLSVGVAAVAATAVVGAGVLVPAWSDGAGSKNGDARPKVSQSQRLVQKAAVNPITSTNPSEMQYVPLAACGIVDTKKAGGKLGNGSVRTFAVRGNGSLAGQGGSATGCKVPQEAAAIAVHTTAASPTSSGGLRLNASDLSGTGTASVIFQSGKNNSAYTNVPLAATGTAKPFKVTSSGSTHVQIAVVGYYVGPMRARVSAGGVLTQSSRAASSQLIPGFTGQYEVIFDRNISQCAYTATSDSFSGFNAIVQPRSGNPNGVFIATTAANGTLTNAGFYVTVTC